ncbi:MAG: quinone oxidoreductase family protein [Planctomycetaceae bacterium]
MKALFFDEHGGPEVLRIDEVPTPEPGEGEVLVRVEAASLNHHDLFTRRGMPGITTPLPMVPGCDAAGTVATVGPGVRGWSEGDRVLVDPLIGVTGMLGDTAWGSLAEFVKVEAQQLLRRPDDVDAVTASCLPVAFGSAHRMLFTRGRLVAGERILILGASGGLGTCCVLLAKLAGAHVIAATGSAEKAARLRELGADETIDTSREDIVAYTRRTTGRLFSGGGFDVVMNSTGGETWAPSLRCARIGGRVLLCGATAGYEPQTDLRYVWTAELDVLGSDGWRREDLATLLDLVRDGRLRPVIDRVLPLEDAKEGMRLLEERRVFGKVVITP